VGTRMTWTRRCPTPGPQRLARYAELVTWLRAHPDLWADWPIDGDAMRAMRRHGGWRILGRAMKQAGLFSPWTAPRDLHLDEHVTRARAIP
jgi:hypothetical protein